MCENFLQGETATRCLLQLLCTHHSINVKHSVEEPSCPHVRYQPGVRVPAVPALVHLHPQPQPSAAHPGQVAKHKATKRVVTTT